MSETLEKALELLSSSSMSTLSDKEMKSLLLVSLIANVYEISELQQFVSNYLEMKKDVNSRARKDVIEVIKSLKINIVGSGQRILYSNRYIPELESES